MRLGVDKLQVEGVSEEEMRQLEQDLLVKLAAQGPNALSKSWKLSPQARTHLRGSRQERQVVEEAQG